MQFRILGALEVVEDGRPVELAGGRQRTLLALLLLHANKVVSSDRLIDGLWGERPPATAPKVLQNAVSQLRRALGDELIVTRAPGYLLRADPDAIDARRFEALLDDGRQALAAGQDAEAAATLRQALGLWRGPPLDEFSYEPFAEAEIARLDELRLRALEERIEADLALGRHADLVSELERLVAAHPLRDRLRGQLMLALYQSGRQAEALQAYQDGRRVLVEELGLEPGAALQQLEKQILIQDPALEVAPARATGPPPPLAPEPDVPTGTVTFLFTDMERSTRLVRRLGDDYGALLEQHHRLLRAALGGHGGHEVDSQGDAFFFAFRRARDAVAAAVDVQRAFAGADWPQEASVRVRIGINTGEPGLVGSGYHGLDVVRAARISAVAHGGQILVSTPTRDLVGDEKIPDVSFRDLGEHPLQGIERPEHLFQVVAAGLPEEFPDLRTATPGTALEVGGRGELAAAAEAALEPEKPRAPRRGWRLLIGLVACVLVGAAVLVAVLLARADEPALTVVPNSLVKIDPETHEIVDVFRVGGDPFKPAIVGDYVFVSSAEDGILSRIDVRSGEVDTFGGLTSPAGVAAGVDGTLWVGSFEGNQVSQIQAENYQLLQLIEFPERSEPWFVAVGGGSVWVSHMNPAAVSRFDARTGKRQQRYLHRGYSFSHEVAFGEGAAWGAASTLGRGGLLRIDALGGGSEPIEVGEIPIAVTVGFSAVWLTDLVEQPVVNFEPEAGQVLRVDPARVRLDDVIPVGKRPAGVATGGGSVWVANGGETTISEIDPRTNEVVAITTRYYPHSLVYGHGFLWVSLHREPFTF